MKIQTQTFDARGVKVIQHETMEDDGRRLFMTIAYMYRLQRLTVNDGYLVQGKNCPKNWTLS